MNFPSTPAPETLGRLLLLLLRLRLLLLQLRHQSQDLGLVVTVHQGQLLCDLILQWVDER